MEYSLALETWEWIAILTWPSCFAFMGGMALVVYHNGRIYKKTNKCSCADPNC